MAWVTRDIVTAHEYLRCTKDESMPVLVALPILEVVEIIEVNPAVHRVHQLRAGSLSLYYDTKIVFRAMTDIQLQIITEKLRIFQIDRSRRKKIENLLSEYKRKDLNL